MEDHATEVALWRYGIIVGLLAPDLDRIEARRLRAEILEGHYVFQGKSRKVTERTLRRWLESYRRGGFKALGPKTRKDRGRPRGVEPELLEKAVSLREEVPERSTRQIIDILALDRGTETGLPRPSTLSRHLRQRGKTRKRLKAPKGGYRRYEMDRPNLQW